MNISVQQMSGDVTVVAAAPDMTICELKRQLKGMREWTDEAMKKMTLVELVIGETKLIDDGETVMRAGLSEDVVLQVYFTVRSLECSKKNDAGCSLDSPFKFIFRPQVLFMINIPEGTTEI